MAAASRGVDIGVHARREGGFAVWTRGARAVWVPRDANLY